MKYQVTENALVDQQEPEEIQCEDEPNSFEYTSLSSIGVKIHKGSNHKYETRTSLIQVPTSSL